MDAIPDILPMRERRYEKVPVDQIKVINSRDRDEAQFALNVESIEHLGLLKPIRVNDKFLERTGFYELVCGEGRLLAHRRLEQEQVLAEVVTCSRKDAFLQSLIENLARTSPGSMDYARELKRLRDEGWSFARIAAISRQSENYVKDYIRLMERGEERLIQGVEQGIFPIKFAIQVGGSTDAQLQNVLMDAFDAGLVTTANFSHARRLLVARSRETKRRTLEPTYTAKQLEQEIADATKSKSSYVREAQTRENRFLTLLSAINHLWQDPEFLPLLREEGLSQRPDLTGDFRYEP